MSATVLNPDMLGAPADPLVPPASVAHPAGAAAPESAPPAEGSKSSSWGTNATLLTVVTVLVSLGNYVYSFLIVHLMSAQEFSRFSAAQGLMLVLGSGCMAAIPWAMARFIAERDDRRARQEAMHFGLVASVIQGTVFAVLAGGILWAEAGPAVGVLVAISAFVGSIMAVPLGFLQGVDRMVAITGIRVAEFLVRFASGVVILLLVSRSAEAALIGYPIGAIVLIAAGLRLCRSGLPPKSGQQATIAALARQSANLGAIQVFLATLGALDTVAALAAHLGSTDTASYQSAALLGRIPLFMSAAIGLAAYVHVVSAKTDGEVRQKMAQAIRLYAVVAVPFLVACLTVPDSIMHVLIPSRYGDAVTLLRFTAISGVAVGWIDIVSTAHQARGRFRSAIRLLGIAAVAQPLVLIIAGRTGGIWVFASAAVGVSVLGALALSVDARHWLPRQFPLRRIVLASLALTVGILTHGIAPAWIGLILIMGAVALSRLRAEMSHLPDTADTADAGESADVASAVHAEDEPAEPAAPRVLIVGDSWAAGLGARGASYGKFAAADLGAEAVLDLSAVSKSAGDTLADAAEIRAFAPTLAILFCGGTESLVHPGPVVQSMIERYGPKSWKGLAGLEPRAVYSGDVRKRRRQEISATVRVTVKRLIIALTGGGRRMALEPFREGVTQLVDLLDEVGTSMVFVSMFRVDDRLFPGTREAMADTQSVLDDLLAGCPNVAMVDIHDELRYYEDFLQDNLHLNPEGHRRVAGLVVAAARPLLAARSKTTRTRIGSVA